MATAKDATEYYSDGMPQLDPAFMGNLIFWFIVTILAIYFIMSRIAIPRISSTLEERASAISRDIEQAANLKQQAEDAEAQYNAALANARAEAEIQGELDIAIQKADAEIAARSAESEARIEEIRASASDAVKKVAKDTASEIIKSVMPGAADAKSITAAITAQLKG